MLAQVLFAVTKTQLLLALLFFVTLGCLLWAYQRRAAQTGKPIPWRKVNRYLAGAAFLCLFLFGEPLFRWIVYAFYDVQDRIISANIPANQVLADKVIGGWVQVGTLLSKLFAAISFYIISYTLPWLLQGTTHPVLTQWAKEHYTQDFYLLEVPQRFEVYGRLQLNQSIRFFAALIAAALLV